MEVQFSLQTVTHQTIFTRYQSNVSPYFPELLKSRRCYADGRTGSAAFAASLPFRPKFIRALAQRRMGKFNS